jgi:hypothetical protein
MHHARVEVFDGDHEVVLLGVVCRTGTDTV